MSHLSPSGGSPVSPGVAALRGIEAFAKFPALPFTNDDDNDGSDGESGFRILRHSGGSAGSRPESPPSVPPSPGGSPKQRGGRSKARTPVRTRSRSLGAIDEKEDKPSKLRGNKKWAAALKKLGDTPDTQDFLEFLEQE